MPSHDISAREFYRQILRFYVPLAVQAVSQSLTYPLVGSIVSKGELGADGYGAFAQGQMLLFVVGAFGSGLIATGMVFARSKAGMGVFRKLVAGFAAVIFAAQLAVCFGPLRGFFFGRILGLSGSFEEIARITTLTGIPMQIAFLCRNISLVALYNEKKSAAANNATLIRIAATAALAYVFVRCGLVGHHWGMFAMTVPVFGELFLTRRFARGPVAALADAPGDEPASLRKQLEFSMPLSISGVLLSSSSIIVAHAIAHAKPDPDLVRTIHYIVIGIVNPLGFAALKTQSAMIAFPPDEYGARRVTSFVFASGLFLSAALLLLQIPAIGRMYFCGMQNIEPGKLGYATGMALVMGVHPLLQSLRGRAEGLAALRRRPSAVFAGQTAYLLTMILSLWALLKTQLLPGHLMGGASILAGLLVTLITIHAALRCGKTRRT